MNVGRYVKSMATPAKKAAKCQYCGHIALSYNNQNAICSFCEAFIDPNIAQLDEEIVAAFALFSSDASILEKSKILVNFASKNNAKLLVGIGNLLLALSDVEYDNVNYNLNGYMEQNSENREASISVRANANHLLHKAIKTCSDAIANEMNEDLLYTKLMAELQLGMLAEARASLNQFAAYKPDGLYYEYASMALNTITGKEKEANKSMDKIIASTPVSISYYLALHEARKKHFSNAEKIIKLANEKVESFRMQALSRKIKTARSL